MISSSDAASKGYEHSSKHQCLELVCPQASPVELKSGSQVRFAASTRQYVLRRQQSAMPAQEPAQRPAGGRGVQWPDEDNPASTSGSERGRSNGASGLEQIIGYSDSREFTVRQGCPLLAGAMLVAMVLDIDVRAVGDLVQMKLRIWGLGHSAGRCKTCMPSQAEGWEISAVLCCARQAGAAARLWRCSGPLCRPGQGAGGTGRRHAFTVWAEAARSARQPAGALEAASSRATAGRRSTAVPLGLGRQRVLRLAAAAWQARQLAVARSWSHSLDRMGRRMYSQCGILD